jgi:hypothetical protein
MTANEKDLQQRKYGVIGKLIIGGVVIVVLIAQNDISGVIAFILGVMLGVSTLAQAVGFK